MDIFKTLPDTWLDTSENNIIDLIMSIDDIDLMFDDLYVQKTKSTIIFKFNFDDVCNQIIHITEERLRFNIDIYLRKNAECSVKTSVTLEHYVNYEQFRTERIGHRNFKFPTRNYEAIHILKLVNSIYNFFLKLKTKKYLEVTTIDLIDPMFLQSSI